MLVLWCVIGVLSLILSSCSDSPSDTAQEAVQIIPLQGAFVLCEGLMGQENAGLWRIERTRMLVQPTQDLFRAANTGRFLGSLASDLLIRGDTAYIVVSQSRSIEVLHVPSGRSISRISMGGERNFPRSISMVNDSLAWVSDLYDHSVLEVDIRQGRLTGQRIAVGYAPEDLVRCGRYVFVANSGYGDLGVGQPGASSVSVIDIGTGREVQRLENLPNVQSLRVTRDSTAVLALFTHLPSARDSLGGLVEIDASAHTVQRTWRFRTTRAFDLDSQGDNALVIDSLGVLQVPLRHSGQPRRLVLNPRPEETWYSIDVEPSTGEVWIGNAKNFTSRGQVLVLDPQTYVIRHQFSVGLNPRAVFFY